MSENSYPEGSTRARGQQYEDLACDHLVRRGFVVLERNVECGGVEIDIVAFEPDAPRHVFVEVRARSRADRGHPLETIDETKRRRLIRGATAWLVERGLWDQVDVRFDVIALVDDGPRPTVVHIEDAYWADRG